jgi:hypothetical protein
MGADNPRKWQVPIRWTAKEIEELEAFKAQTADIENLSQAVRALVRRGLEATKKKAKKGGVR